MDGPDSHGLYHRVEHGRKCHLVQQVLAGWRRGEVTGETGGSFVMNNSVAVYGSNPILHGHASLAEYC